MKNYLAISKCSLFCSVNYKENHGVFSDVYRVCSLLQKSIESSVRHILSYYNNYQDYDRDMHAMFKALANNECACLLSRVYDVADLLEAWSSPLRGSYTAPTDVELAEVSELAYDLVDYAGKHCKIPSDYITSAVA